MTTPITEPLDTISKYEASVKPQGNKRWDVIIEEVHTLVAAPTTVISRSTVSTSTFNGTEEECRASVCQTMKALVADRDAVNNSKPFKLTESDLV